MSKKSLPSSFSIADFSRSFCLFSNACSRSFFALLRSGPNVFFSSFVRSLILRSRSVKRPWARPRYFVSMAFNSS